MELLLLLLALPIILIIYFQKQKAKPVKNLHPPGPPGLPFIGNLHQFDGQFPHKYLYNLSKQYGPFMSMKLGFRPVLVISSADIVKQIMKSHDIVFSGRPLLVSQQRLSYNGLDVTFSSYGNKWREMRKMCIIRLFSQKQVHRSFIPVCKDEVTRMIKKIARDASVSRITNLSEMVVSFTSNTIYRVAFGKRCEDDGYQECLAGWRRISGTWILSIKNSLRSTWIQIRPKSMQGDILDSLLGLKREGSSSVDPTLEHIKAILMNILAGGTDTGSATIVWAITALMKNPLIMRKAQAEIRQQLAGKKELIDEDDIVKLPYLRAVIKETFRDPKIWKNPDEFVPERFLDSEIDVRGHHPEVIPFGIGWRGCPAMLMGMAEVELGLANLLYAFDWKLPPAMKEENVDFDGLPGLTMHKKSALCAVAKPSIVTDM
ncbi:UNVERIFIED_CONTAM: cytochrome [Sesamum radiatum]|uniref:Cytochrome n=1 Tax=Sesamum radiatum TaxID=300843 RepID=A0AAW2MWX3_SESRA